MTHNIKKIGELADREEAIKSLNYALRYFGRPDFLFTLRNIASAQGVAGISKKTGISREGLYKILHPCGNPRLDILFSIMDAMGLSLYVMDRPSTIETQVFRVIRKESLASLFPSVAFHWHPTKNLQLTADDITVGSRKKIWWCCADVNNKIIHEWQDSPVTLIKRLKMNLFEAQHLGEKDMPDVLKKVCPFC